MTIPYSLRECQLETSLHLSQLECQSTPIAPLLATCHIVPRPVLQAARKIKRTIPYMPHTANKRTDAKQSQAVMTKMKMMIPSQIKTCDCRDHDSRLRMTSWRMHCSVTRSCRRNWLIVVNLHFLAPFHFLHSRRVLKCSLHSQVQPYMMQCRRRTTKSGMNHQLDQNQTE